MSEFSPQFSPQFRQQVDRVAVLLAELRAATEALVRLIDLYEEGK